MVRSLRSAHSHQSSAKLVGRVLPLLLSLLVALVAPFVHAAPAALGRSSEVDLPALALTGNDLIGLGIAGYGAKSSYSTAKADDAHAFLTHWGMDELNDDGAIMGDAGADRFYFQILSREYVNTSINDVLTRSLVFDAILEYTDEDAASDGVQALTDGLMAAGSLSVAGPNTGIDADEVVLLTGTGKTPNPYKAADTFPRANAILRSGNLVAVTALLAYDVADVTRSDFEGLLAIQADRLAEGDGPGLSAHLLRLDVPPADASLDTYTALDGVALPGSATWETADAFKARQKSATDSGLVASMHYEVLTYRTQDGDPGPYAFFNVFLYEFPSRRDARLAFDDLLGQYLDAGFYEYGGPELGDESAYIYRGPDNSEQGQEYAVALVRMGTTFFLLRHLTKAAETDQPGVVLHASPEGVITLAEAQADCLDDAETCVDPMPVPRILKRDQVREDATPPAPLERG